MDVKTESAFSIKAKRIADLSGPRRWPVLGNLLQLDIPRFHEQLEGWAGIYGPLYRLRIGSRDALVVSQPDLIASILRDRPDGWSRFEPMRAAIHEMGVNGLFTAEGEAGWRQHRLVAAAFTPSHLKRYFPLIKLMTERLKGRLDAAAHMGSWIRCMIVEFSACIRSICPSDATPAPPPSDIGRLGKGRSRQGHGNQQCACTHHGTPPIRCG